MDNIEVELEKIRFHLKLLGEAIDHREHPIECLVLYLNWSESQLERAHDIFEEAQDALEQKQAVNWGQFEHKLRDEFNIGYQSVKSIVLAFYRNHQWTDVCKQYAEAFECSEFHEITRRGESD